MQSGRSWDLSGGLCRLMKTAKTANGFLYAAAAAGGTGSRLQPTVRERIIFAARIKGFLSMRIRGWRKCTGIFGQVWGNGNSYSSIKYSSAGSQIVECALTNSAVFSISSGIRIPSGHIDMQGISLHVLHMKALSSIPMFNFRRAQ